MRMELLIRERRIRRGSIMGLGSWSLLMERCMRVNFRRIRDVDTGRGMLEGFWFMKENGNRISFKEEVFCIIPNPKISEKVT